MANQGNQFGWGVDIKLKTFINCIMLGYVVYYGFTPNRNGSEVIIFGI